MIEERKEKRKRPIWAIVDAHQDNESDQEFPPGFSNMDEMKDADNFGMDFSPGFEHDARTPVYLPVSHSMEVETEEDTNGEDSAAYLDMLTEAQDALDNNRMTSLMHMVCETEYQIQIFASKIRRLKYIDNQGNPLSSKVVSEQFSFRYMHPPKIVEIIDLPEAKFALHFVFVGCEMHNTPSWWLMMVPLYEFVDVDHYGQQMFRLAHEFVVVVAGLCHFFQLICVKSLNILNMYRGIIIFMSRTASFSMFIALMIRYIQDTTPFLPLLPLKSYNNLLSSSL